MTEVKYNDNEIEKLKKRIKANNQFFTIKVGESEIVARTNDVERFSQMADYQDEADVFWVSIYKTGEKENRIYSDKIGLVVRGLPDSLGNVQSEFTIKNQLRAEIRKDIEFEAMTKRLAELEEENKELLSEIADQDTIIKEGNMANQWASGLATAANLVLQKNPNIVEKLGGLLGGVPTIPAVSEEDRNAIILGNKVLNTFSDAADLERFTNIVLPFLAQDNALLNDFIQKINAKYGQ